LCCGAAIQPAAFQEGRLTVDNYGLRLDVWSYIEMGRKVWAFRLSNNHPTVCWHFSYEAGGYATKKFALEAGESYRQKAHVFLAM